MTAAQEVGKIIGNLAQGQEQLRDDLYPDEPLQALIASPQEKLRLSLEVSFVGKTYESDSFVPDHPVLGIVDSSTLIIDGGYASSKTYDSYES